MLVIVCDRSTSIIFLKIELAINWLIIGNYITIPLFRFLHRLDGVNFPQKMGMVKWCLAFRAMVKVT